MSTAVRLIIFTSCSSNVLPFHNRFSSTTHCDRSAAMIWSPRQQNESEETNPRASCRIERRADQCIVPVTFVSERSDARAPTWASRPSSSASFCTTSLLDGLVGNGQMAAHAPTSISHQRSTQFSRFKSRRTDSPRRCELNSAIRLSEVICSVTLSNSASPATRASRSGSRDSARRVDRSERNSSKSSEPLPSLSALWNIAASVTLSLAEDTAVVLMTNRDACSWNSSSSRLWSSFSSMASKTSRARSVFPALTCSSSNVICCCCSSTVA
mmetsp:Transcript_25332/g.54769  ORF Transcript_25332/g.54769 Transcript_25332/m.54769 type:complete len:270 (+) Transcript_25332:553-1362(+)